MTDVLIKRENLEVVLSRRTACEDEGRDWGEGSTSQETPRMPANYQELSYRPGQILLHSSQKGPILLTPDLRLLASRALRQSISVV